MYLRFADLVSTTYDNQIADTSSCPDSSPGIYIVSP